MFALGNSWIVKVVTGRSSQTVNIRPSDGPPGPPTVTVRLRAPRYVDQAMLAARAFQTPEALVEFLRSDFGGILETGPAGGAQRGDLSPRRDTKAVRTSTRSGDEWTMGAVTLVERAIDRLVLEFLELPYLHRVEHSVHCELYTLLTSNRTLGRPYPLAGGQLTQLVHKEWPEFLARPGKRGRGNFDFGILHPDDIANASVDDFQNGRVEPIIAIELGLDYGAKHLSDDVQKLTNSAVRHAYVVHLARDPLHHQPALVETLGRGPVRIAAALSTGSVATHKLLDDVTFH